MELTPFWRSFLITGGAMVLAWIFIGWPIMRRRRRPSQLGDILRRLSEEREAERKRLQPSPDHDLADLDDRR